jgi:protein-S-isoprenylcysteine O-methyltransferase Ste14
MSVSTSNMQADKRPDLDAAVRRRFTQIGLLILIQAVALFGAAGHLNWLAGWVYVIIYVGFIGLNAILLLPHGKELIAERGAIKKDVKSWDKAILALTALLGPAVLVVAGLDDRYGWSPFNVYGVRIGAAVVICLGYGLFSRAMATNSYFSASVRLQRVRGQSVVTDGPYRYVRHPGYVGMIILTLATPLLLGSVVAMVPAVLLCITVIVRTWLEDNMLQQGLNGYAAYTQNVRYRLLPGLW